MSSQKFIILILLLSAASTFAQYPNIRINPTDTNQIEPSITVHPSNPQVLFASAYTVRIPHLGEGYYITTNGGTNWFGSDKILQGSSTTHGGDPGPVIDKDGRFILTHRGRDQGGWWSNYSTNVGTSWSNSIAISLGEDQDKGSSVTDDVTSSSHYGRTYHAWTRLTSPFPIVLSYTVNGGQSWSAFIQINSTPGGHFSVGPSMAIGIAGQVYVSWAAAITSSPQSEDFIGFAVSTSGGVSWTVWENAYDCSGIKTSQFPPWNNIRVNGYPMIDVDRSGGPRNGWIFIVTGEKNLAPAGTDPDIVFHRSTNGGVNWSQGIRVNQDPLNNGRVQFFPAINVDDDGGINVVYYDTRHSTDSVEVFISRSTDGGNSWADYLISDHKFRPAPVTGAVGQGNMGDNIGITSSGGNLYPVWMDNKVNPGLFQILTAIINYNTIGIKKISSEVPEKSKLKQNYPNPFNPTTTIEYDVSGADFVTIKVYDHTGKLVRTLAESTHQPGKYSVVFDASNLSSGVYFYTLSSDGFAQTKKMLMVK
jgi:hypothetical protein